LAKEIDEVVDDFVCPLKVALQEVLVARPLWVKVTEYLTGGGGVNVICWFMLELTTVICPEDGEIVYPLTGLTANVYVPPDTSLKEIAEPGGPDFNIPLNVIAHEIPEGRPLVENVTEYLDSDWSLVYVIVWRLSETTTIKPPTALVL
jgi:hypothetical protein